MKFGAVFPHSELANDYGAVKEFAQAVEAMGFNHIVAAEHVLGANTASRPNWNGPYDLGTVFYDPFVLFSYMAGVTSKLGFVTGVLILPQRQAVLVAKQAACLDLLCGGRLRLGIGTGWNEVEYEALGMSFADRGKMFDDQIEVLRALWTQPAVTYQSALHTVTDAGINPLPRQRPIPLWFGGGGAHGIWKNPKVNRVIRRIARVGDGWMPPFEPNDEGAELLDILKTCCQEYGRNPSEIGLEAHILVQRQHERQWADTVEAWRRLGASHVAINTMYDGLSGLAAHLKRFEEVKAILPASSSQRER